MNQVVDYLMCVLSTNSLASVRCFTSHMMVDLCELLRSVCTREASERTTAAITRKRRPSGITDGTVDCLMEVSLHDQFG